MRDERGPACLASFIPHPSSLCGAEVGQPLRQQEPAEGRGVYYSAPAGSCPSPCSPWVILGGVVRSAGRGRDFGLDRPEQAIEVEGPIVTPLVDEERRSAVHAAANASHEVLSNTGGVDVCGQFPDEAGFVKTEG